jgi:L-iditol 2-dehydrogenase
MKALIYEGPWQMAIRDIDAPQPGPTDVIVSVKASGICGSDVHGYMGITGRRVPGIAMGHEFSGVVAATGQQVADFKIGDRVIVQPEITCQVCEMCKAGLPNNCVNRTYIGAQLHGGYAEAVQVPQQLLYRMPDGMSWEQGAMVEPAAVAMRAVNRTPINLMDTVVIIGAGTIGLLALAWARLKGAGKIVITDVNPHRLSMALELGADAAVNVGKEDPLQVVNEHTNGRGADCVIEAVGMTETVQQSVKLVRTSGHVTWIGNSRPDVEVNMQRVVTREIVVSGSYAFVEEFPRAIEAIGSGRLNVMPLVERVSSLDEGPQLFHDLASGTLDVVKVVLKP